MDLEANSEDLEGAEGETEPHVYRVSEINAAIRELLEGEFSQLWVQGEISNFKAHTSGHFYFSLKDAAAQVNAVMFKGHNRQLKFKPQDGMEVLVRGKVTVYEPRGNYQIFCELMEPVGAGALQIAFDQLKKKLQAEGLFDAAKKRPIPRYPQHVALVTSPTGAAIRDMLNVLRRRFKGLRVTLVPALVQGEQAPSSLVSALAQANRLTDVDVIIIGRGGGSMEDLWAFNDESLARAIAGSRIPVISAVGHEVDFTIADFVADLRAPTPSAAAELVVRNSVELIETVATLRRRLTLAMANQIQQWRRQVDNLRRHLIDPQRRLRDLVQRCDELTERLTNAVSHRFDLWRGDWRRLTSLLDSLSPLKVVDRGYALVSLPDGRMVKSVAEVKAEEDLIVRVADGKIHTRVVGTERTAKGDKQ